MGSFACGILVFLHAFVARHYRAKTGCTFVTDRPPAAFAPRSRVSLYFGVEERLRLGRLVSARYAELHGTSDDKIVKSPELTTHAPPTPVSKDILDVVVAMEDRGLEKIVCRRFVRSPNDRPNRVEGHPISWQTPHREPTRVLHGRAGEGPRVSLGNAKFLEEVRPQPKVGGLGGSEIVRRFRVLGW